MENFDYKYIKSLFLKVGSKSWADSCMTGRCSVSKARLQELQKLSPDTPIEFFIFPERYKKLNLKAQEDKANA